MFPIIGEVVIRTNGGELKLDAPNDNVKFYGNAQIIDVDHISSTSLWMYGAANMVNMSNGRLVITNFETASVGTIFLSATEDSYNNIILATQNGAKLPEIIAREEVTLPESGKKKIIATVQVVDGEGAVQGQEEHIYLYGEQTSYEEVKGYENVSDMGTMILEAPVGEPGGSFTIKVKDGAGTKDVVVKYDELPAEVKEEKVATVEEIKTAATMFDGGKGTVDNPYLISNRQQFENIKKATAFTYYKIKSPDVILDLSNWDYADFNLYGCLDGNNASIINLDQTLFNDVGCRTEIPEKAYIKDLKISANIVNASWETVVCLGVACHDFTFENVDVTGYIEGGYIATYCWGNTGSTSSEKITFKDCESSLTMVALSDGVGGFINHSLGTTDLTLINSKFTGTMSAPKLTQCIYAVLTVGTGKVTNYTDDNDSKQYNGTKNGQYTAEGKVSKITTRTAVLPNNIGDVFSLNELDSTIAYGTFNLEIGPNDTTESGYYVSTYMLETVDVKNNSISSNKIKYFKVRVNADGVSDEGPHGNYYDVFNTRYGHTIGGNTKVKLTLYTSKGAVVEIVTWDFNDKATVNAAAGK